MRYYSWQRKLRLTCPLIILVMLVILPWASIILANILLRRDYDGYEIRDDNFIAQWEWDDPRLINHIKKNYLYPPAPRSDDYNLKTPDSDNWSQKGITILITL